MSHPDEYGQRREPKVQQFPLPQAKATQVQNLAYAQQTPPPPHQHQPPQPASTDPHDRAAPVLDQIAEDIIWLPYGEMMEFAKDIGGEDKKNEMAEILYQWAKKRRATR